MMIRIIWVLMCAFTLYAAHADVAKKADNPSAYNDSNRMEERIARRGGLILRPGMGSILFCNCTTEITDKEYDDFFMFSKNCPIPINFKKEKSDKFTIDMPLKMIGKTNCQGAIFLINNPLFPMTLCAMEDKWGVVNINPLLKDNPSPKVLRQRVNKLFTRVMTVVFGGGNQEIAFSAMKTVCSLKQLDQLSGFAISPANLTEMSAHLESIGVTLPYMTTYIKACREGWAPAPTNDIQKAIWEKVHALPKNPIKIEFDPKKGR